MSEPLVFAPLDDALRPQAHDLLAREWGSVQMVSRGVLYDMRALPGIVAQRGGVLVGLATYRIDGDECELMSLNSAEAGRGIGGELLNKVIEAARGARCRRVILITTNDNLHALGFYQRRGFRLAALYANALEQARRLKPEIPLIGLNNIPLRDELELTLDLG